MLQLYFTNANITTSNGRTSYLNTTEPNSKVVKLDETYSVDSTGTATAASVPEIYAWWCLKSTKVELIKNIDEIFDTIDLQLRVFSPYIVGGENIKWTNATTTASGETITIDLFYTDKLYIYNNTTSSNLAYYFVLQAQDDFYNGTGISNQNKMLQAEILITLMFQSQLL